MPGRSWHPSPATPCPAKSARRCGRGSTSTPWSGSFAAQPAGAQLRAACPQHANPGWIGYPRNLIDYSDGYDAGNFLVWEVWDRSFFIDGPQDVVTYRTQPDIPWDVVDATKMWFMAAILVQCYSMVIGGEPFLIVQEIAKYGYIEGGGSACGPGDDDGISDPLSTGYDPYASAAELETTSADCRGEGGGGGGGSGGGVQREWVCVDAWVPGEGWVEIYCGWAEVR